MAKNRKDRENTPASTATARSSDNVAAAPPTPSKKPTSSAAGSLPGGAAGLQNWDRVIANICQHYLEATPQRTKLLDVFMGFLAVVGAIQFLYCVLAGNYPFNAFLSGFSATVGQFVLTASLRIQTTAANKNDFPLVSQERAFADFIVCSLILHFFCINFIN